MPAQLVTTDQNADDVGFIFVGVGGTTTAFSSPIGNLTWTARTLSASTTWNGLATGSGYVMAVGLNGATNHSIDGITWTAYASMPSGTAWADCAFGNGFFVSVNASTTTAAYTNLLTQTTWTASTLPSSGAWAHLAFHPTAGTIGRFLAVASNTTAAAYSDDNGATWLATTLPASLNWGALRYANGYFVLIANGSRDVYTSTDGTNWTLQSTALPSTAAWAGLAWISGGANGTWVATASSGTQAAYSTDNGITWGASVVPTGNYKAIGAGKSNLDGRQIFITVPQSSTAGIFSYDGITWFSFTAVSGTWNRIILAEPKFMSGDTLTINNGATLTVNTNQDKYWASIAITNGKLRIENSSTTTPIRFGTGRLNATGALHSITPASGLGSVEVVGNWITVGTSTGAANQTMTSPYSTGDFIPALWVETGNGTNVWEIWVNVTGFRSYDIYNYTRNGFRSVGSGSGGKCFTQNGDQSAVQYLNLSNCNTVASSNVITCTSTTGLHPGTWLTGRGLPSPAIVEQVINSTTFTIHAKVAVGNGFTGIPIIGIKPVSSQYSTTLNFGDGTNGAIPVNGARVRIPNILLTDYTNAFFQIALSSTNSPCSFVGTNGGLFSFNTCLFGESYSNYTQAQQLTINNCGFSYVPYVSECYQLTVNNVGCCVPPVMQLLGAATALGATGSTNSTTTITTPATTALIPGVLITGTNLQACTITSITNTTTATVSTAAFGTGGSIAFTYFPNWTPRDQRWSGTAIGLAGTFNSVQWQYVSGTTVNNMVIAYGGGPLNGANTNSGLAGALAGAFNLQLSNDITVDKLKVIQVGSNPRTRPTQTAISLSTAGSNIVFNDTEVYNMNVLGVSAHNTVTMNNVTHRPGINNETHNWANAYRAFTLPSSGAELSLDTKYWFRTRSYRTHDWHDTTSYVDGLKMCAVYSAPDRHLHTPRYFGAVPAFSTVVAPSLAYGNGCWVALNGQAAAAAQTVMVSEDDGASWTNYMLPTSVTTAGVSWWKVIYSPAAAMFVAIGGGGAASTLCATSYNGKDWSGVTTAPASAQWQSLAYDNSQATNKWVAVSGGSAVSTTASFATLTNGSMVWASSTIASAQWIDVAASGAGRYVAIAGGSAVGTATAISTNGSTWSAGGANVSSAWQSIAYGASKFVCISSSATNGPTAYSADGTAWTASTAPTLPTGMNWNNITWSGTVFVITAGPTPLSTASPGAASSSSCYATSTDGITWSALKYLPDNTFWIAASSDGSNKFGVISTQTGRFAYNSNVDSVTPWNLYTNAFPTWNRISWLSQAPEYTQAASTITSVATTLGSPTVTCASTAALFVGAVIVITNATPVGAAYIGTGGAGSQTYAVIVTGITNGTTFTINKNASRTATGLTGTIYNRAYQLFRSTTEGFTARDSTTLIGATPGTSGGTHIFDDTLGVVADTTYYYRLRKLSGFNTVANCSGTAAVSTITTSGNFYNWQSVTELEGVSGTNVLKSTFSNFYSLGIVPGCIVTGTGIPLGTTVASVDDFNSITLSANLTGDVYARGASRTTVGFSPAPGMWIYGSNVGVDARVASIDSATSMTVTVANTNTFTTQTLTFVSGFELPEVACIPQIPLVVQNNLLQSTTLGTTWVASNTTPTNAAALGPLDNFVAINGTSPTGTASSLRASAANGTLTQTVNTGIGSSYTFSVYARARLPDNREYITMTLDLGSATNPVTLTNKWTRYFVTFTAIAGTTNAVITLPLQGSVVEIQHAMVTLGSSVTPPIPATTTTIGYLAPKALLSFSAGLVGYLIDSGAGIETTLATAPTGQFFNHLHVATTPNFTLSDQNMLFSTETPSASDMVFGVTTASTNVSIDNYQPVNEYAPNYAILTNLLAGSSNVTIKNSTYGVNGTTGILYAISAASPAYNLYLHNIDINNPRSYIAALYQDGATANNSKNFKLQNIRSNRTSRFGWNNQGLQTIHKAAPGLNPYPAANGVAWDLNTAVTTDSFPLVNTAVYDNMFHEMTYGATGKGCLDIRMIASSAVSKPYTITSGAPSFSNEGNLFFKAAGDQIIIEWPHAIRGITGFDKRLPHVYGTDIGLSLVTGLGILVEYDLDKGSGYSGVWKRVTGDINTLAAETGIDPAVGVRPKFRLTARQGLRYTGQSSQFIVGETIENTSTTPTATFEVVEDEVSGATTTGTLIVTNVTGTWSTANTLFSAAGTTRATITATNSDVFFPQPTSRVAAIRIFTLVDSAPNLYPFSQPFLTLTGLVVGSEVRVFKTSDSTEFLTGTESCVSSTFTAQYDYYSDTDVYIVVMSLGYKPIRFDGQILGANGLTLPIQQQVDRNFANA